MSGDRFKPSPNDVDGMSPRPEIPMRDITAHFAEEARATSKTPPLTQEEARAWANRWAAYQPGGDPVGVVVLLRHEREQLFAWVRERMAAEDFSGMLDPKLHLAETIGLALDIDDSALSHAEYLDRCWVLCDAAGWPS